MVKEKKAKTRVKKKSLSMKEALGGLNLKKSEVVVKKRFNIRDFLWNYPSWIANSFKRSVPFSYILLFSILGILFSLLLQSSAMEKIFNGNSQQNILTEGCVGSVSTLNPLFVSVNDIDQSLQSLVFEKFVDLDGEGKPMANIAKSWGVSDDGLTYDFDIAEGLFWHDGTALTVDDVVFTFETAIALYDELSYDSVGASLSGTTIEKIDEDTVRFTLSEDISTFYQAVSVYIVPKHRLENVQLQDMPFDVFAKYPVGSGEYELIRNDENYIALKDFDLDDVNPNIGSVIFRLYPDYETLEAAFRNGVLDAVGYFDPNKVGFLKEYSSFNEYEGSLDLRNKMIFLNNRSGVFEDMNMRIGLNYLVDIDDLLARSEIKATPIKGPISEKSWAFSDQVVDYSFNQEKASEAFKSVGYVLNGDSGFYESEEGEILSFTLSYLDNDFNNNLVDTLKECLYEKGVVLKLEPLTYAQISQETIATRNFEMLLYEIEVTVDPDQYNLWHSLKSNYPDLNISGYNYERVDILLEEARDASDRETRVEKYALFQRYLTNDAPVIFLYHPTYTYVVSNNIEGIDLSDMQYIYQRFSNISDWVIN